MSSLLITSQDNVKFSSPSSAANITVVSAVDSADTRPYFANYGNGVTIFAPGVNIKSTYIGLSGNENRLLSGTSMASPHVAGLVNYYQCAYGLRTNKEINDRLRKCSAKGYVKLGNSLKENENVALNCFANSGGTVDTEKGALVEQELPADF